MPADAPVTDRTAWRREELLIAVLARLLDGVDHVAVGASSPIPGAAALLARALSKGDTRVSVLGSRRHNPFTEGGRELFDCAAQGRIGAFFLGGGEIDGQANINLVGMGDYPKLDVRFPGSFGSAYLYMLIPRVILFREEHTRRVMVPRVNFISAPGTSDPGVHRPGGPHALVTNLGKFDFDRQHRRFRLASVHPGHTAAAIAEATGFDYDQPASVPETEPPPPEWLELLRGRIAGELAETYPKFASAVFGVTAAA